jgi:hypothetical protein
VNPKGRKQKKEEEEKAKTERTKKNTIDWEKEEMKMMETRVISWS